MNGLRSWRLRVCAVSLGMALCGMTVAAAEPAADPLDWPHWRGPEMNGISREKGLPDRWSPDGENLIWKNEQLATRSTPIVLRGKLYTICRSEPDTTKEGEKVVCADANTGKILWESIHNVFLTDAPAERVGWSSVVGDPTTGNVFAHGICGVLKALDGETGKVLWEHSLSEEYGILSTYGGRTNFPTLFEDLVIVSGVMTGWGEYAIPAHRIVAFDKRTGQAVWMTSTRLRPPDTTYSTPILAVFNGQAALVFGASDGAVHALQPRTGKEIWKYDASIRGMNQTPVISGNKVWCGHSEEDADDPKITGSFFCIDGSGKGDISNKKPIWSVKEVASGRSAPLLLKDRLYVTTDAATMFILDAKTGKEVGKQKLGTIMMSSVVYGDGKIYACEQTGRWYVLQPTAKGTKVVSKGRLNGEELLASPIISHGKVYISSNSAIYCIGLKDEKPSADPRPAPLPESPTDADTKPAHIQVIPVEVLLRAGQKQQFLVRTYNAKGRYLNTVPASFELTGPGKINAQGEFASANDNKHSATMVTAKVDGLTSTARVRTIPPLPWNFDFSDKQVPATWIGLRYRHVPRIAEGNPMIAKVTNIPLGTRSQGWFGPPDVHDVTIQADMKALGTLTVAGPGPAPAKPAADATKPGAAAPVLRSTGPAKPPADAAPSKKEEDAPPAVASATKENFPDMGLINQRYTLDMMGNEMQLQLRSWTSRRELRFAKSEPFKWKLKTWYVLKLRVDNQDGKALVRGKAWPRGEKEPEKWNVEATDGTPNTHGSPGLFGNSLNSEILIDNVKIYANGK